MKTILCVEDEPHILENNHKALADNGYNVLTAERIAEARERLARQTPDAIILDIMLPDGLGLDLLTELRAGDSKIPILLLTAWGKPSDVARGLKLGANDYLSKPFDYEVLIARVETMFRNVEQLPERLAYGKLSFDVLSGQAFADGVDLVLKPKEYALLLLFAQNPRKILEADELYKKVWKTPLAGDKNTLQATISSLRKKINIHGFDINILRGKGYYFE